MAFSVDASSQVIRLVASNRRVCQTPAELQTGQRRPVRRECAAPQGGGSVQTAFDSYSRYPPFAPCAPACLVAVRLTRARPDEECGLCGVLSYL